MAAEKREDISKREKDRRQSMSEENKEEKKK